MTSRRRFLQGVAAAGAWTVARPYASALARPAAAAALPDPATAPFDHVVVLMFENRSFDHLLGWLPGADGKQSGLQFADQTGTIYPTYELAPDPQGCGYLDPDHSWEGFVVQHNAGANDGWLKTPSNRGTADTFPIGYYSEPDLPAMSSFAKSYTVLDRYFASFAGETFPNRFYQHAARTDRDHNMGITQTTLGPTIWDRLADAGLTGGYYFTDEPFILLWGTKYVPIMHPVAQFLADAAAGTLPNVSFVDPSFANEGQGQSGDYHPHGDIRAGEAFLSQIYHAVRSSPAWDRTVLVVNFDEWGGFYDHVVPPRVPDDTVRAALTPPDKPVPDYQQLGFRVPCIVASPWSPAKIVSDGPYEHTSVLKMIEWRWGLSPLTQRDANALNLAQVLDFSNVRTDEPDIPNLTSFASIACGLNSVAKQPPQPLYVPPGAAGGDSSNSNASTDAAGSAAPLARTGTSAPLLFAGAAAITGGMALRAAYRKSQEPEATEPAEAEQLAGTAGSLDP